MDKFDKLTNRDVLLVMLGLLALEEKLTAVLAFLNKQAEMLCSGENNGDNGPDYADICEERETIIDMLEHTKGTRARLFGPDAAGSLH